MLVSGMLSAQTRDAATSAACSALAALCAPAPVSAAALSRLSLVDVEAAIRPVSFYRNKAKRLLLIATAVVSTLQFEA